MQRVILFLLPNRYGIPVGETRLFDYGPAEVLVQRGIASWYEEPKKPEPAPVPEVETTTDDVESETKSETPKRRKRSESTEE